MAPGIRGNLNYNLNLFSSASALVTNWLRMFITPASCCLMFETRKEECMDSRSNVMRAAFVNARSFLSGARSC